MTLVMLRNFWKQCWLYKKVNLRWHEQSIVGLVTSEITYVKSQRVVGGLTAIKKCV
jgi:hypothetical protein